MADIETVSSVLHDTSLNRNGNMKGNEEDDLDEKQISLRREMFKEMSHFYPKTLLLIARQMSDGYMEDHSKATAAFSVLCAGDALSLCLRDKIDRPADMHQMKDVWKNAEGAATYNDTGQDPNDEEFALTYFALGRAYLSRALRDGKMQFLSDAIRSYEASLDYFIQVYHRTGEDSVNRITVLINLAGAYQNQHDEQEAAPPDLSALRRGINHAREALALRPPGHPRRWEPLLSLGQLLDRPHKVRPSEDVFTEIVTYRREGLEQLPQGYGNRLGLMNEFAAFIQSQQPPLLTIELAEEAVQLMRAILQALPAGMARLQCMNNLAGALDKLYRVNHDASTIDEALSVYEAVLKELPKQNPLYHIVMDNLANSHNQRWAQTNDLSSVDASLRWRKEVLAYAPDHPNRGRTYHSLGVAHGIRFQKLRSIEDMEEGLRYFREALFTRKDPDGRVETLHQLSILLKKHYELTKNRSSLISCIKFLREVLKARQPPNPSFFAVSGQLAEVLMDESKELGEEESLRKSIDVCLHAVTHIQAADEEQARTLFSLLGGALIKDYMATGCLKTLDEAISALQQAESMGNDGTGKVLGDLITAFRLRSEKTDDLVDRDAMDRYSLQLRNSWIHSSDNGLKFRFAHHFVHQDSPDSLSTDDRDAVFASTKDFLEGTPRSHSGRYLACIQHAMILLDHPLGHFNFLEAMKLMVEATEAPVSSHTAAFDMLTRVLSDYNGFLEDELAQDEMEGGTHTWRTALLDVYIAVIRLFPKVVYFGLDQRDQLVSTQNGRFAAIAAASHALMLNKTNLALELLEQGRALFWNQALRLRARDAEFSGVPSDVALELKTIFGELDELHNSADEFIEQITWPAWARDSVAKARRQSVRAQQLIEEVRAQPGLDRFLLGPSYNDMSALAVDGHIIVVLVAHSRGVFQLSTSEAIIITSPNEEPLHISLPLATVRRLAAMAEDLQNSNETYRSGVQAEMEASRGLRIARTVEDSGTTGVLKKLWFAVVKPIIDVLQLERLEGRSRPRIHWCPTGQFMFVPVHAAGTKDESCSDYFVSSYTPTLSALVEARRNPRRIMREELRVLLAATKDAYRLPTLWSVHEEISIIKSILPPSAAIDITEDNNEDPTQEDGAMLNERETEEERIGKIKHVKPMKDGRIHARERHGINSTMDDVLAHIPHADIVHLACHGTQDDDDPLASGFQLAGGSMTFRDLMRLKLEKPLLAYLGACDTAKGHDYLAEEAFHLCSAMLFMGFKSVVGTMWAMGDVDGPTVAKHFYKELVKKESIEFDDIPHALDFAVQSLRKEGVPPHRWATFIHMGA